MAELREFLKLGGPYKLKALDRISVQPKQKIVVENKQIMRVKVVNAVKQLLMHESDRKERYLFKISQVELKDANDVFVRLFINAADEDTAKGRESIHYAGSFAFFGNGEHAHRQDGNTYYIDVTDTIERLRKKSVLKQSDDIMIVLSAVSIADGKAIPRGKIELSDIEVLRSEHRPAK